MPEKQTLRGKAQLINELIKTARSTANPFKANEMKKQIEALSEALILEAVATMDSLQSEVKDLQLKLAIIDKRLSREGL